MGGCPDNEPGCFISYFILFTHPRVFIKMHVESMCQISVMKIKLKAKAFISCLTSYQFLFVLQVGVLYTARDQIAL